MTRTFQRYGILILICGCAMGAMLDELVNNPIPCHGSKLYEKSCAQPDECLNACAFHCSDGDSCKQCCSSFWGTSGYVPCREACKDVFE
ncbi:MAG: hypothetical protein KDA32_06055 [Phycisphaerales bacterium]|nr:hypothetical protein [Phycisphaerales bacterium]